MTIEIPVWVLYILYALAGVVGLILGFAMIVGLLILFGGNWGGW